MITSAVFQSLSLHIIPFIMVKTKLTQVVTYGNNIPVYSSTFYLKPLFLHF